MNESPDAFWSTTPPELLWQLETTPEGLTSTEAQERLRQHGPNLLRPKKRSDTLTLLLAQFKSPIILILILAAGLSFLVRDPTDALIIILLLQSYLFCLSFELGNLSSIVNQANIC